MWARGAIKFRSLANLTKNLCILLCKTSKSVKSIYTAVAQLPRNILKHEDCPKKGYVWCLLFIINSSPLSFPIKILISFIFSVFQIPNSHLLLLPPLTRELLSLLCSCAMMINEQKLCLVLWCFWCLLHFHSLRPTWLPLFVLRFISELLAYFSFLISLLLPPFNCQLFNWFLVFASFRNS